MSNFYSLLHACAVLVDWQSEDNNDRPPSSLGYLGAADYVRKCTLVLQTDD
jgi:transposase InsO family protein